MKRINILLCVFLTILFVACSESLESKAKSRYRDFAEIFVSNPESLICQGENIGLSNDSICVISFIEKTKEGPDKYVVNDMEYFIVKDKSDSSKTVYYEAILNIEDRYSHIVHGEKMRSILTMEGDSSISRESTIYYSAIAFCKLAESGFLPPSSIRARKVEE